MPATINGIGTHYYGKKNLQVRTAICGACQRMGSLSSYDTRLWFVVVFIPIIPLGRKRIIDQCASCLRHRVADADAFEQAKQLETSAGLDQFRRNPSPDSALGLHAQLLAFHEMAQAADFRRTALDRFPRHAGLRVGFAQQLDQFSEYLEAAGLYEAALNLEPDLPAARTGVAHWKMASGELDEARALLSFAEVPGAGAEHNLGPIDVLAGNYQRAGRHREALELAAHLLRELPDIGRQHAFRAFVGRSEKALAVTESILPERRHSVRGLFRAEGSEYSAWQRRLLFTGLGLGLLTVGLAANNEYIRRHRRLNVVNACGGPVEVSLDGAPVRTVSSLGTIPVSEGHHRLRITGPVDQTVEVDLDAAYLDRWFKKPVWVLNPGAEAVLDQGTIYYANNPRPGERRLVVGLVFTAFPHIDYPFEPPPQSIQGDKRGSEIEKSVLQWIQGQDAGAFLETLATNRETAQAFAERRLRREPVQNELLKYSVGTANPEDRSRVEAFLKLGLGRRPVWVQWHRAYQYMAGEGKAKVGDKDDLIAFYDQLVAKEPKSGALVYLRARIEPDLDRQEALFHRAIEIEPTQPWPYFARGRHLAAQARWNESLKAFEKAGELHVDAFDLDEKIHTVRLARGDAKTLAGEYRSRLAAIPTDLKTLRFLCDALAVSDQDDQIEPVVTEWVNRLGTQYGPDVSALGRAVSLYQAGNLEECERVCSRMGSLADTPLRAQALLALGRTKEVSENKAFATLWDDPWNALALSLASSLDGQSQEADAWREHASKTFESQGVEHGRAAALLRASEPVPVAELERIGLDAHETALICAVFGARFPAKQAEYAAAARRFNILRKDPYRLILRATDGAKP